MQLFDTYVQKLKYKVLREVARHDYHGSLQDSFLDIPKLIAPGPKSELRCCVYKERAIVAERVKMAMGGDKKNPNVIEVIDIACDECPVSGFRVGPDCRGCIAHRCASVCPRGAISFDENHHATIDPDKCVNCGKCASVCPYSAIQDKSFLLDAIHLIRESESNKKYRVYAVVAPSISSQFVHVKVGQVITALKQLGFYTVIEAALGADMVAYKEAQELAEKGFLTSSCCPAFVSYIKKAFPSLKELVSHNLSPMAELGRYIKQTDPTAKVIFIGPCTAKKAEAQRDRVKEHVDCVLTFEELQAWIDSSDLDLKALEVGVLDNASYFGRIFARSGGLSDSVAQSLKEQKIDFIVNPVACDGIEECRVALLKKQKNLLKENFIEGMACTGGCIGGAGCLTHGPKDKSEVDKYGREAYEKTILDSLGQCNWK